MAAGPACVCLCAPGVACTGWEWRSPRRGWGRHASRRGVGAHTAELRGAPSGGFQPERPRSGRAELPTSLPSAAARLCGSARRGTWQTLPGRREQRGPPSGSPEGRLLPPLDQPPRFASAPSPACLQLLAWGPLLSPARRRAPSGWGAWTLESPFGATSARWKEPAPRGRARMEVPGGSDPSGDGAGATAPDPRAPGAAAPSSGPCAAARESERQQRLRLCVLNEILGTERDYVGTLRFLQSVSVPQRARGQRSAGASARSGPLNLWPRSLGVARVASGAPAGDTEK